MGADLSSASKNRVLNNMKLCGSSMVLESPQVKVQLAEDIWSKLVDSGMCRINLALTDVGQNIL